MKPHNQVFLHRTHGSRRGQALIFVTLWVMVAFGMAALVLDFGFVYYYQCLLNSSTQAAALAGAWAMSQPGATVSSATAAATLYSGTSGNKNAYSNLQGVTLATGYPVLSCRSTLTTVFGIQVLRPRKFKFHFRETADHATALFPPALRRQFGKSSVYRDSQYEGRCAGALQYRDHRRLNEVDGRHRFGQQLQQHKIQLRHVGRAGTAAQSLALLH